MEHLAKIREILNEYDRFIALEVGEPTDKNIALYEHWIDCKSDVEEQLNQISDLEDNGLMLRLPFKVGDKVYVDSRTIPTQNMEFEEVVEVPLFFEAKVVSFRQNCNGIYIKLKVKAKWLHEWVDPDCGPDSAYYETEKYFTYPLSAIGKTVFLTQEQAKQKLKEMEGE